MRRVLLIAGVAVLVALAGCTTGSQPAPSDHTTSAGATPEPTTNATTAATTNAMAASTGASPSPQFAFPAGTSANGVTDPEALVNAHVDALASHSYVSVWRHTLRRNGTRVALAVRTAVNYATHRARYVRRVTGTDRPRRVTAVFVADTSQYTRRVRHGNETVSEQSTRRIASGANPFGLHESASEPDQETVEQLLSRGNFRFTGTVTRNGTTYARYELASYTSKEHPANGTLLVRENGVIHRLTVEFQYTQNGVETATSWRYVATLTTPSVERPAWAEAADAA